jgi:hypothetical protein
MKLLKRDRKRLESIAQSLQRGIDFVLKPDVALMISSNMSSTDVFTAPYHAGEKYNKINKEMGCEFVVALTALRDLKELLKEEETL